MNKVLLALVPFAALAQSPVPETPEFDGILNQILTAAQPFPELPFRGMKYSKQLELPGAGFCRMTDFEYSCMWEARPNKYSVAMLQNTIASRVGGVVPKSWERSWENSLNRRTASFADPVRHLRILVTAPATDADVVLVSYTVTVSVSRTSTEVIQQTSEMHFRSAEALFGQHSYQAAANEFREVLNGDRNPKWVEVWTHIELGKIFDLTGQRERAVNEYRQAQRTGDNTNGALEEATKYLAAPYQAP